MSERNYLLKVLSLSGTPKVVTFGLTLVSFPFLIRAMGATEYGTILIINAALGIFEVLVDFGISSAAGKAMASTRANRPEEIRREFFAWARLQVAFIAVGFLPMLLATLLVIQDEITNGSQSSLVYVLAVTAGSQVVLNFIKANLLSLLAFQGIAVLETMESVLRSSGFLIVAFFFPTAFGMSVAGLTTSFLTGTLAIIIVNRYIPNESVEFVIRDSNRGEPATVISQPARLKSSLDFLWLRLSTRIFQQGPSLILGRVLGAEIVGIIGSFNKIIEIAGTPYQVIGNALMVRVNEFAKRGPSELYRLWDTAFRFVSTSLVLGILLFLIAAPIGHKLLPQNLQTPLLFSILSSLIVATALFALVAPMSDYMGGLTLRNALITGTALLQIPILWLSAELYGAVGAVIAYVVIYYVLGICYVLIASKVFFNINTPTFRSEVGWFVLIALFSGLVAVQTGSVIPLQYCSAAFGATCAYIQVSIFLFLVVIGNWFYRPTRSYYLTFEFFEFSPARIN